MFDFTLLAITITLIPVLFHRDHNSRKIGFWLCFALFAFLSGFRAPYIGNDTEEYLRIFREVNSGLYDNSESRYEIGYLWLNQILGNFSDNSQIIFIATSLFIYYSFGRFILKYSKFPWLSLFLFLTYGFFSFSITVVRQSIAIAILLFSYDYILKNKFIKFLGLVILATLFHSTAVFFIFSYLCNKIKINSKTILIFILIVASAYALFNVLLNQMFSLFPIYEHYDGGKYFGETRLASVLYVFISSIIFIFSYLIINTNENKQKLSSNKLTQFNSEAFMIMMAIGVYVLSMKLNILDRIAIYYNIFSIVLLPNAINLLNKNMKGLLTFVTILLFFAYSTTLLILRPGWNSVFPYSFCF